MIRTVGIVSLSSGILGEPFVQHEVRLGLARLQDYGLQVRFLPHARAGLEALRAHPEWRAEDLLQAFRDPEIDLILCAIGGDDTYRLAPYLFETGELQRAVTQKPFLGFSDTTIDHFMLRKVGLPTFYGQAFLPDVCELDRTMLPYTRQYFEELLTTGRIRCIRPSDTVYESRKNFGESQLGTRSRQRNSAASACCRVAGSSPARSSAAASTASLTCLTPRAMRICRRSAGNTGCSRQKRNGGAGSCCSSRARNRWRPRNTKRRWYT